MVWRKWINNLRSKTKDEARRVDKRTFDTSRRARDVSHKYLSKAELSIAERIRCRLGGKMFVPSSENNFTLLKA